MQFTLSNISKFAALLVALTANVDARPQNQPPTPVGRGNSCDLAGVLFKCNAGLTCDTMPGSSSPICLDIIQLGGTCNKGTGKCAGGLYCDIKTDQWQGTCKSGSGPAPGPAPGPGPAPTPTPSPAPGGVQVGHKNSCGNIGGTLYTCTVGRSLVCAALPSGGQPICLIEVPKGGQCNNEGTICTKGSRCNAAYPQYYGTCV
ncbi:hypothetical protein BDF19DRAFT_414270 [Syncephalis fuscata]|nr:hypothetical protein BDF19DRAFT_414270 [Syncephalis fuscata]